jgi:hypothetical protein
MVRFLALIVFFTAFMFQLDMASPFISAIALLSFVFMIVGLKPFVEDYNPEAAKKKIVRDKGYFVTILLTFSLFGIISADMYHSIVWDVPEALNPSESLRIGDTDFFERAYSLQDIKEAKALVSEGVAKIGTVINYAEFLSFFLTLSILYISLLTFNAHWNNSKAYSFFWFIALLSLFNFYSSAFNDIESRPYDLLGPEETINQLYPVSMDHCSASYQTEGTSSTVDWENKSDSYIVNAGSVSSVVTVTSDNKDLVYKPGQAARAHSIGAETLAKDSYGYAFCDENSTGNMRGACDKLLVCVSAVHFAQQKNNQPFVELSYDQASEILNAE